MSNFETEGQAFLQGIIAGSLLQNSNLFTKLEVEQSRDENGDYLNYFHVELDSGRYRVSVVREETTIKEIP